MTRHFNRTILGAAMLVALLSSFSAAAGPGHDHGDAAPAATGNAPRRLPDGSVFLPKPAQRQLEIRTTVVKAAALPQTFTLTGKVVADPNAGGKVQPTTAGRIEAGPRGLPVLGQRVRKGEVLAWVRAAETATPELTVNLEQARRRLARLEQLEGVVPQREIDSARIEVQSLGERLSSTGGKYVAREALLAPVSGVIASASVMAGQVVEPRELLFEIVDPARLQIEATAHDAALAGNLEGAHLGLAANASSGGGEGKNIPLRFIGSAAALRDGAIPLLFSAKAGLPLAVGQPVKVIATTRQRVQGHALPASALVKNPGNQDIVWVHEAAERFVPRTVRWRELDGASITIIDGLRDGARVVVNGASLVNQVR